MAMLVLQKIFFKKTTSVALKALYKNFLKTPSLRKYDLVFLQKIALKIISFGSDSPHA